MNPEKFQGKLVIEAIPKWERAKYKDKYNNNRQLYRLVEDFSFFSERFGEIKAEKGLITDFASVPSFTKCLVDDDDPDILFACIPLHDVLYSSRGGEKGLERKDADSILKEAMEALGASKWKILAVHSAVRIGGWFSWRE